MLDKSQKYMGRYIAYAHQQSAFPTTNGALYLSKLNWYVDGKGFDTLAEAKSYIFNMKTTGEEF